MSICIVQLMMKMLHWATETFPSHNKTDTQPIVVIAADAVVAIVDVPDAVVAGDSAGVEVVVATFVPLCCSLADVVVVWPTGCSQVGRHPEAKAKNSLAVNARPSLDPGHHYDQGPKSTQPATPKCNKTSDMSWKAVKCSLMYSWQPSLKLTRNL